MFSIIGFFGALIVIIIIFAAGGIINAITGAGSGTGYSDIGGGGGL